MFLIYSSVKKDFLYWNVLIFIMELTDEVKIQMDCSGRFSIQDNIYLPQIQ